MALSPLLVDAKKEYTYQLADVLTPYVFDTIAVLYDRSKRQHATFREYLRRVPHWNASTITEKTNEIERKNPQLQDLIAACCVSYTKVLGSIRLSNSQNSNFRIALPESGVFVHGVYIHVAKEFYYAPDLVTADRATKMGLVRSAVEESVRQHVPIKELLKAYLSVAIDTGGQLDPMAIPAAEEYEDQPADQSPVAQSPFFEQQQQQPMMMVMPQQQQQQPMLVQPVQPQMVHMVQPQQVHPQPQPFQTQIQPQPQPQPEPQPEPQQQPQPQPEPQQLQQQHTEYAAEYNDDNVMQVQYVPRDTAAAAPAQGENNDLVDFE